MIRDLDQIHKEFNRGLLQRKGTNSLWGSPFENALIGVMLANHTPLNRIIMRSIGDYLDNWIKKSSFDQRDLVTLSLYSVFLSKLGKDNKLKEVAAILNANMQKLVMKELDNKFSIFNSPELFYFASIGIRTIKDNLEPRVLDKFKDTMKKEAQENWRNKPTRFAYFAGSALELNLNELKPNMKRFINSLNIEELRIDEVIPLFWFFSKYQKEVESEETLFDQIFELFDAQRPYFSYEEPSEEQENAYFLSNLELALLDEAFSILKIGRVVSPKLLYDALQIHPRIKDASEKLFRDGHYAQAIFEAYKELVNIVKEKSGKKDLDGQDLMAKVFSFNYDQQKKKIIKKPMLQFNKLSTVSERDEQEGFRFLFMGATVGIRNPKGHERVLQKDPFRTLEYLNFASLLARRVDEAKKNKIN